MLDALAADGYKPDIEIDIGHVVRAGKGWVMAGVGARRVMHQTTLRFSHELWAELEEEAGRCGVSVAQWLRHAAVERLTLTAVAREAHPDGVLPDRIGALARLSPELRDDSRALIEQAKQARRTAQRTRQAIATTRSIAAARRAA